MKIKTTKWMIIGILLFFIGGAFIVGGILKGTLKDLPSVKTLEQYVPPLVTQVLDTSGSAVGEFFTERRTTIPLNQIPMDLRRAVIAIEDTDFNKHWGVNPKAIVRATLANLRAGRLVQGGSTLTQQLAKTIFLTRKKTLGRKVKEMLLTLQIEKNYSKDEIMELYLNQIYFGGGAYGVEAASRLYFGKRTQELNLSECALLGGLIRLPNRYSPVNNPEISKDRRATVLKRMREVGYITELEEKEAAGQPILNVKAGFKAKDAPYFVEEVFKTLEPTFGSETLEQSGLNIHTTLDLNMQRAAELVLEKHLSTYDAFYATATLAEYIKDAKEKALDKTKVNISTTPPKIQGALVVMDVHTGAIRTMIGGRDFYKSQFNRVTQAKRQPGSSFKAFAVAAALEGPFTAASVVDDYPLVYVDVESDATLLAETTTYAETTTAILDNLQLTPEQFWGKPKKERDEILKKYWRPQNYDGKYLGPLTIRKGLQKSRNLVTIRLVGSTGPRTVVQMAKKAGIESHVSSVLSTGLGTSVTTLLELTNAYGTFASGGLWAQPYFIEKITDRRGKVLQETSPKVEARVNPQTAFLITNLLRGVIEYGTGAYARRIGKPLGGKTGTTQDQRDLLFIGFSPDLVCGVWIGYDDFRPLKKGLSASHIAVPLWTEFMKDALKDMPAKDFPVPPKIEYAKIDADTGYLALSTCPKVFLEAFKEGTVPTEFCPYDHLNSSGISGEEEILE
ncbi:MAG: penicillin-binding protein 1A [Elusimicrobiota bacterium]